MKQLLTLLFALFGFCLIGQEDRSMMQSYPAMASAAEFLGDIPPLREIPPRTDYTVIKPGKLFEKRNYFFGNEANNPNPQPANGDPLLKPKSAADGGGGPEIIPGFNFEGLHDPSGVFPPDPTGDIGKDHYVQMVNTSSGAWIQVWDKYTGNSVYGPALSGTIWSQVGSGSSGDCIIQYDHNAERWLMMELQGFNSNQLLVAISATSDPLGAWKAYRIQTLGFPDYPKLYVWHNAYFITVNEILGGNKCSGYALNRNAMIAGDNNVPVYRFEMPNFGGIAFQPATGADWEGGAPPPAGSPGLIFRLYDDAWNGGQDHLDIWEVFVDWANLSMSHIDGPSLLYPAPFETRVCFGSTFSFDCIEQPGAGSPRIAALENIIMYRAPYRNFGSYQSVVLNHVTDVSGSVGNGGDAEIRWYEIRKTGAGSWQIHQQGTHAPDVQTNRFMGAISMDEAGNIGLGYSGCSQSLFPGLYLTGHRADDPAGEMTLEEHTLAAGGASHTMSRWGDYSSLAVDPYDGRTFWFTGEYQPSSNVTWGTRIGSFKVQRDTYDIKPELLTEPTPSPFLGNNEAVKVRILNGGLAVTENVSVSLFFENNLVVTDVLASPIDPGSFAEHTFSQTVAMPVPGKNYKFRVVTHWAKDQFLRNDTLDQVIEKLTSNDAALVGKHNLPGLVCGTNADFGIIIKNASALPMTSAKVDYRINTQAWQVYDWTGNLEPGARDTILLQATNLNDGLNSFRAISSLPNGLQDEKINNDTLLIKFFSNTDGTYLSAESVTEFGTLHWELRNLANALLAQGDVSAEQPNASICSDDNTCYKIVLRANTFNWKGHFTLRDIFGKVLVEITEASSTDQVFTVCSPVRQQVDFGPLALEEPVSGPNLGAAEPITLRLRNFGLSTQSNITVGYNLNGGAWKNEVLPGPFTAGQTITHTFAGTEDLSQTGSIYDFKIFATVAGDQNLSNDTSDVQVLNSYIRELELLEIDASLACSDTSFALINVVVQNNGIGDQHTFDVEYTLNGIAQPTIPDNQLFAAQGESEVVPLYIPGLKIGDNSLILKISNIDGSGPDENPGNDGSTTSFNIDPDNQSVDVVFSPDSKPEETTWDIIDSQGNIVYAGGPYIEGGSFNIEAACLKQDSCYTFRIHDSGGDGMSNGYASVTIGGFTIFEFSGEPFTDLFSVPFCATALCADLALTATVTNVSGAGASDGQIEANVTGGNPPFFFILNGGDIQDDPVFSGLPAGSYELIVLDILGCSQEIIVNLGTVSTHTPQKLRRVMVTPNPTPGIAHLELAAFGPEKKATCNVFDSRGKLIQTVPMSRWDDSLHGNIALDNFPSGVYHLRIDGLDRIYGARVIRK